MTNEELLIRRAYAAFNARETDAAFLCMREDVVWPKASEGGRVEGKAAIRAYWTRQWAEFDPYVEPLEVTEGSDGTFAVRVHQVVKSLEGELLFNGEVGHVFRVVEGLIAGMELEGSAGTGGGASAAFRHDRP